MLQLNLFLVPPNPSGGGGSGGFWSSIGSFFSSIGSAIGSFFSAIGNWFSSNSGTGGEAYGSEGGYASWDPSYYPDPSYGGGGNPFDVSSDPFFTPYIAYYANSGGGGGGTPPTCPTVTYTESATGGYFGFDDYTNSNLPYLSVAANEVTSVRPVVNPSAYYADVYYESQNMSVAQLQSSQLITPIDDLSVHGEFLTAQDEVQVLAKCGSLSGPPIGTLKVVVYPWVYKTVLVSCVNSAASGSYAGYNSNDLSDVTLQTYLRESSFNQGVVRYTVFRQTGTTITFDSNQDGNLEANPGTLSSEQLSILNQLKTGSYNTYLFYVNNPSTTTINGQSGTGSFFSFIYTNITPTPMTTIVHEIGHAHYGFQDIYTGDSDNFMWGTGSATKSKFRKSQWDIMHN